MSKIIQLRSIFQLKITLDRLKPRIFRTILVEDDRTFYDFHHIIQIAMGWENYHLFQFVAGKYFISDPFLMEDDSILDSKTILLKQLLHEVGDKIEYQYDFGDGWTHSIRLEKIIPIDADKNYPFCIRGKRSCPPEDCGGTWGYEDLIDVMGNKKHPEYMDMKSWLGGDFDPEDFDIEDINMKLEDLEEYIKDSMYNSDDEEY